MEEAGGDLGQGFEDEAAVGNFGVGESEDGCVEDLCVDQEQIEIDDAGALYAGFRGGIAIAAHGVFDREEPLHEGCGCEGGFEQKGGVEKAGLVGVADGRSVVQAGHGADDAQVSDAGGGFAEVGGAISEGGREVGAKRDGGEGHATSFIAVRAVDRVSPGRLQGAALGVFFHQSSH